MLLYICKLHSACARRTGSSCLTGLRALSVRRLGINKFADWTQDEYEALVLPTRGRAPHPTLAAARSARLHAPAVPPAILPSTVDWRGTPADSPVKDQAACGSCWVWPQNPP